MYIAVTLVCWTVELLLSY